jgi:4-hydroxy-2-oxoheptanedioate aldolase
MKKSIVKEKLKRGEPIYTVKVAYQDPALYELVGNIGFDCIWICNEHIGINPSNMDSIIRACRASGIDAMVRTKPGSHRDLIQPLEMGANGLMLPRVKNVEEVKAVIEECKFPPEGMRGVDGISADADFGLLPLKEYMKHANENTFLMVQIETLEVIDNIEEIAAIEGVDILFVGPADLSLSLGCPGEFNHPKIQEISRKVVAACNKYGKTAGIPCGGIDRINERLEQGFKFLCGASDYRLIKNGFISEKQEVEKLGIKLN